MVTAYEGSLNASYKNDSINNNYSITDEQLGQRSTALHAAFYGGMQDMNFHQFSEEGVLVSAGTPRKESDQQLSAVAVGGTMGRRRSSRLSTSATGTNEHS